MYKWIEIQGSGYVTPKCCSLIRESVDSLCRDDADAQYTSHKKVFQMKTSACRDGTLKNQPNKMGTTP